MMMHCNSCNIDLTGDLELCPLCGTKLEGEPSQSPFPINHVQRPTKIARQIIKIVTLICIAGLIVLGFSGRITFWGAGITSIVLVLNYLFLRNVIAYNPDSIRIIERYFLVALAMSILLWLYNGYEPFASMVVPGVCAAALITNTVLIVMFRSAFMHDYAKYVLYSLVMGLLPLLLVLLRWVSWPWGAVACAALTIILFIVLLVMVRGQTKAELRKLFNS